MDDMITKLKSPSEHVKHLEETFGLLRKYKMKLNQRSVPLESNQENFLDSW